MKLIRGFLFTNWATKKKTSYFPFYWLDSRDPFNGLFILILTYIYIYITGWDFIPLYNPTNQPFFGLFFRGWNPQLFYPSHRNFATFSPWRKTHGKPAGRVFELGFEMEKIIPAKTNCCVQPIILSLSGEQPQIPKKNLPPGKLTYLA